MKVLMLNTYDNGGGAANATYRLAEALRSYDIEVDLGVLEKRTNSKFVIELKKKKGINLMNNVILKIFIKFIKFFFNTTNKIHTSLDIISKIDINYINSSDYDLIHLNWIHQDMLSIMDIGKIKKPLVVTLHDSWFCCGAEHHPNVLENDNRWQLGYFRSNKPNSTKGIDLCKLMWLLKKRYWTKITPNFVAPSSWEKNVLKTSYLYKNSFCEVIPNIINHKEFHQIENDDLREIFSIPKDKIVLGFGAAYGVDDPKSIKGTFYLINALKLLQNYNNYFIVIFGSTSPKFTKCLNIPYYQTGFINDNSILAKIYNVIDIFLNPSIIESFGLTTMEAMCCGVPTVAFDLGGTTDIIEHKKNGYMAKPYSIEDFKNGIIYCSNNIEKLKTQCLLDANQKFNNKEIVDKYIKVYNYTLTESITNN